jgi:tripartite-type tricarboxylate transporter receptor subunit TctC
MINKIRWTVGTVLAAPALALMMGAAAADYPEREITLIVPFGAGGSTDIVGRTVSEPLSQKIGVPIVVENRGGAGGTVGTRAAAEASNDGYTMSVATTSTHVSGFLWHDPGYHPIEDFEPISLMAETPYVLLVHPDDERFGTLEELVEYALERPGELNFGSAGVGSTTHLSTELFNSRTGIEAEHIPYGSNREATIALISGETDYMMVSFPAGFAAIDSGLTKAVGVGTAQRNAQIPDVPTVEEAGMDYGLEGYRASLWLGYAFPAGVPEDIVNYMHAQMVELINEDESVQEALRATGSDPITSESPAAFRAHIESEVDALRSVVEQVR